MSGSVLGERLRSGRDVNDGSWLIVRYAADWGAARMTDAVFVEGRGVELAPRARPELAADWLPLDPVAAPEGTLYRADPERDLLLAKGPCDLDFRPVEGIGGSGHATGRFDTPAGVAVDGRGRVYVADAGNARVQVIDPVAGAVVAVLSGGMATPVHVALDPCGTIHVADPGTGAIHVFSARFAPLHILPLATLDPVTGERWSAPPRPRPLAVAVLGDGTLVAFDPARAWLWHMGSDGAPLRAVPWPSDRSLGWTPAARRFAAEAEIVLGPLDAGLHDLAWHRVLADAEMPAGTSLKVQTFAANRLDAAPLAWAPVAPVEIPRAEADRRGAYDRLVLSDQQGWPLWRKGRLTRGAPRIADLDGTGPDGVAELTLPAPAATRLRAGDVLTLRPPRGGAAEVEIANVQPWAAEVAATGPAAAFAAPASVRLIRRDGEALPFGPLDLSFLADPADLGFAAAARDGRPETADLPHPLAAFLQEGDVVDLGHGAGHARFEVLALPGGPVTLHLDAPVPGDFSTCGVDLTQGHGRLLVREALPDTGARPPGSRISVIQDALVESHETPWVDGESGTIWLSAPLGGRVTAEGWTNARFPEAEATDRGRYLWVRLQLAGKPLPSPQGVGPATVASASPLIRSLRMSGPRPSLLAWLPEVFSRRDLMEEPPGGNFLERFLALFEGQFTLMETALDSVMRLTNPVAADEEWLTFVAAWLDLAFDPSWPIARRRQLVVEGAALQAGRGTPAALRRYLEIYTGGSVAIIEGFRQRPPLPMQLGARGALGVAPLGPTEPEADRFAHRFTVRLSLPSDIDRHTAMTAIQAVVEAMKPAQSAYALDTGAARTGRIGMDLVVDSIVIPGADRADPCACDPDAPPGPRPQPGHAPGGFRLGGRLGRGMASETSLQGV